MVKISRNSLGDISGDNNIVIQIIDTKGNEINENLESILDRISDNSIKKIKSLERKIDKLKKKNVKSNKRFNSQANEILALKTELEQKKEILKTKQQREAEVLQNINGLDLREIETDYAKAYEFFIQGKPSEALNLLGRAKLIQKRKKIEKEQNEEIQAWQLRLTLLESSTKSKQDELDECYAILAKLDPSFSNLIAAANHFIKTNSLKKAQFYSQEASKKIKYAYELASTLNQLGILQTESKHYRTARLNFIESIKIYEHLVSKSSNTFESYLAVVYSHLGHFYSVRGKSNKAKKVLDRAIKIQEKLLQQKGEESKYSLAITLISVGNVETDLNNMAESKAAFNKALDLMKKLNKNSNGHYLPDIALICHNYAHALVQRTNDFDEALMLINESIRIRKKLEKLMPRQYSPLLATSIHVKNKIIEFQESSESVVRQHQMLMNLGRKMQTWFSF